MEELRDARRIDRCLQELSKGIRYLVASQLKLQEAGVAGDQLPNPDARPVTYATSVLFATVTAGASKQRELVKAAKTFAAEGNSAILAAQATMPELPPLSHLPVQVHNGIGFLEAIMPLRRDAVRASFEAIKESQKNVQTAIEEACDARLALAKILNNLQTVQY